MALGVGVPGNVIIKPVTLYDLIYANNGRSG